MIIGPCPYECGESHMIPCAPKCPAFSKETCEGCGKQYWLKHSRIAPEAYTLEEFAEKYAVDDATKKITDRTAQQEGRK
jgi:hypothetical protein